MEPLDLLLGFLLSIVATVVPAVGWSSLVWWCDRYEREPLALGVGAFLWGALPAVLLSLLLEGVLGVPSALSGSALAGDLFVASGLAPVVEEAAKGIGLLLILLFWRVEFDNLLDGLIYGSLVGFGFGLTENLLYFMAALLQEGWGSWGLTVFMRSVVFGLNHAFFTAFTGAGIGVARATSVGWLRRWAPWLGLALAVLFHALHNLGASLAAVSAGAILLSFYTGLTGIGLVVTMLVLGMRQEARWIQEELADEVGRLLSEAEYQMLLSRRARRAAEAAARRTGGPAAARAARLFQEAATELAFRKRRLRYRGADMALAARVKALEARLVQARAAAGAGFTPLNARQSG